MRTSDLELVQSVSALDVAMYLRAHGWQRKEGMPSSVASTWSLTIDGAEFEALLPLDRGFKDYARRMVELMVVLAAAEKRSPHEVSADLQVVTADVFRIRLSGPDIADGTVPIEEHAQISRKAKDLMLAAACTVVEPRAVWTGRRPPAAADYVRRVRVGQSQKGSYVLTIISPVTPRLLHGHSPSDEFDRDPFERRVSATLASALRSLLHAADQALLTQQMGPFDAVITEGVSSNLCDAVTGLGGEDRQRSLEFGFSWSPARPVSANFPRKVVMASDLLPVIREAGRQIRERRPIVGFELRGPVIKLERGTESTIGRATIAAVVEGSSVGVLVELRDGPWQSADALYQIAVRAHAEGRRVLVKGTLVRERRRFIVRDPGSVQFEPEMTRSPAA
ncbi:MAG: hypothetical protein HY791_05370 [Deltaproteobacteria bacterium]|nr:hypothetical protein [Deltaproteobacteria bacterium]